MLSSIVKEDLGAIVSQDLDWDRFKDATVLISGANGFVPAYLVETLLHLNEVRGTNVSVVALVRNLEKAQTKFSHHAENPHLRFLVQDVADPIDVAALGNIDFIIHAASQASPKFYGTDPVGTMMPNISGTRNLLEVARQSSCQAFLFFSSGEVYGETDAEHIPTSEEYAGTVDVRAVRSCYSESKRMGESMCVGWHHQYGVPTKIIRLFHTYGPGMDLTDGRVYADFVSDIVHNRDIVMKSNGKNTRAFCYLADAVSGAFAVLLKGNPGEAYNLGYDTDMSIADLADTLVRLFPEKGLKVVRDFSEQPAGYLQSPVARTCPDISKIKDLGWSPMTDVASGFKRTILSYE